MRRTFTYKGKRYSVQRKTEQELYEAIALKKIEIDSLDAKSSKETVYNYLLSWLKTYKEPYIQPKTAELYLTIINKINKYIGDKKMADIKSSDLQNVITSEYNAEMSKSYIDKLVIVLRGAFSTANKEGAIKTDPSFNIYRPTMRYSTRQALTEYQKMAIEKEAMVNRHGLWVLFMLKLGLRPSETSIIKSEDIDLHEMTIHIRGTKTVKSDRTLPLPTILAEMVAPYLNKNYIFETSSGTKLSESRRKKWWKTFCRDVDISLGAEVYRNKVICSKLGKVDMYSLRHTFATEMSTKVPINVLADIMGHESIETTRKYYIHSTKKSIDIMRDALNVQQ